MNVNWFKLVQLNNREYKDTFTTLNVPISSIKQEIEG